MPVDDDLLAGAHDVVSVRGCRAEFHLDRVLLQIGQADDEWFHRVLLHSGVGHVTDERPGAKQWLVVGLHIYFWIL